MDKNILIIGNGFDIYHGLRTKYIDFVKYTSQENTDEINSNMFVRYFKIVAKENQTWIDCEQEIRRVITTVLKALRLPILESASGEGVLNAKMLSFNEKNVLRELPGIFSLKNNYDVVIGIADKYRHKYLGVNISLVMSDIGKELNCLIDILKKYLQKCINLGKIERRSSQIASLHPDYVVNFNYTKTYQLYNINDADVFFIHGNMESVPNNMVLGFEDVEEIDLECIYFKKYFQRMQKRTGFLDVKKFNQDDTSLIFHPEESHGVISHFFGLSMSITDGDMIREIEGLSTKCIVYFYNKDDYESKLINIIDVFGKQEAIHKIRTEKIKLVEIQ